jgi:Tol biopolymer transport system component
MSPEQVEGRQIDSRSDIFSLGVILHEMATGSRPFVGDSSASLMSSILKDEPELVSDLKPDLPRQLGRITKSCLAKRPDRRFQSAQDVRNQLSELREELSTRDSPPVVKKAAESRPAKPAWIRRSIGTAIVLLFAVSLAWWLSQRWFSGPKEETTRESLHLEDMVLWPFTTHGRFSGFPSWSPDGRFLAFAAYQNGTMDIFKGSLEGGDPIRLTSTPANEMQPDWSPDGKTIAFASDFYGGGIFLISSEGGTPWQISDHGRKPRWSPDGEMLSFEWNGGIHVISADGNQSRQIVKPTSGSPHAVWTRDGSRLIYWDRAAGDISVIPVAGGESKLLNLMSAGQEEDIWRVDLEPSSTDPESDPVKLTLTPTDDVDCAVSPDGRTLAFTARTTERNLWALPLAPDGMVDGDPNQLTTAGHLNYYPAVSPDGSIMTWTSHQAGQGLLYYHQSSAGEEKKLTNEWARSARELGVTFSPDSEQIVYASTVGGSYQLWRRPCLSCVELRLTQTSHPSRDVHPTWSPVDNTLAFYSNRNGNWDIWLLDLADSGEPTPLTLLPSGQLYPAWSPDGQLIAFRSDEADNADIWVTDRDRENLRPLITTPGEEAWPVWAPGGKALYFSSSINGSFNIWLLDLDQEDGPRQVTFYDDPSFGLPGSHHCSLAASISSGMRPSSSARVRPVCARLQRSGRAHVLVTDGGFTPDGAFRPLAWFDSRHVERLFRAKVLRRLLDKELISEAVVDNLLSWRHRGFSAHGAVFVQDREGAVRLGRYMIRCPIVLERLAWDDGAGQVFRGATPGSPAQATKGLAYGPSALAITS